MMGPIIEEISEENTNVNCAKLNIDSAQEIAAEYEVMSIPTFIVFKNGKEVNRGVGTMSKTDLTDLM